MYELYIANKNYSSWSLRPWVLMRQLGLDFLERPLHFGEPAGWQELRERGGNGRVPCLVDGTQFVWDSLAVMEYLAETHRGVWPSAIPARAWARSAAAEMHSSFGELRERCSMNCGIRVRLHTVTAELERDLRRIAELWGEGLRRFAGPFLAGSQFTAVDACFAPVAFRLQTYGLASATYGLAATDAAGAYAARLLQLAPMQHWYAEALAEPQRDAAHERDTLRFGAVLQDLRVPARAAAGA
jgi:glutathione S-transferase